MTKTIAIDFDGVIHKYRDGWQDGSIYDIPETGSFLAIVTLLKTYTVFIFTTRDPKQVIEWFDFMKKNGYPPGFLVEEVPSGMKFWSKPNVVGVTNGKLPAIAYIDDRGIRFTNWKDILNYF